MQRFGLETEYGIAVEGAVASDLVEASRTVVRSYRGTYAAPWNYNVENPRRDVRGFDVKKLSRDPHDAQFDKPSAQTVSQQEDRVDRMLPNGARLYNDHGHPEYSTPECAHIFELVAHDKAGEQIVWECAQRYSQQIGKRVQIIKNNIDFHGASYGCHESYLMDRAINWQDALPTIAAFLATRIVFAGAGKVSSGKSTFQLSQRADFIDTLQSVDTLYRRPLVNTRDEPHAAEEKFRRLHVISGDANMSEYAAALKIGTTQLLVQLLSRGWRAPVLLRDPVRAIKRISQDESHQWIIETDSHENMSALDVQKYFCDAAAQIPDADPWGVAEWSAILSDLQDNPLECHDRLDWAAKKVLLDEFAAAENLDWQRDIHVLQSLDIAYADLDPEQGLYHALQEDGHIRTLISLQQLQEARNYPPQDTRAALRGWIVERFHAEITSISWNTVRWNNDAQCLTLKSTFDGAILAQLDECRSLDQVASILRNNEMKAEF